MSKIYYIANIRMPTERAHGIQIMKTCEAFAKKGREIELVVPKRKTHIKDDPFGYYGVGKMFVIHRIWCLDTARFGRIGFWAQSLSFVITLLLYSISKKGIFYTRDEFAGACLTLLGKEVTWEVHMGQKNIFAKFLIRQKVKIVSISRSLKDLYIRLGSESGRVIIAPDGVDLEQFNPNMSKDEAREKLGLRKHSKLVVYTGSRQSWKGVETLEEASKLLPHDVEVIIISNRPYKEIPMYLKSADVLILCNSSKEEISRSYTSPMKLFEYMASGNPIVASDLPSIHEIVDDRSVFFFAPDNPQNLAEVIVEALDNRKNADLRARSAKELVELYSWENRSEKILKFLKK